VKKSIFQNLAAGQDARALRQLTAEPIRAT
jgi:hypothetical protein